MLCFPISLQTESFLLVKGGSMKKLIIILGIGLLGISSGAQRMVLCEEFYQET